MAEPTARLVERDLVGSIRSALERLAEHEPGRGLASLVEDVLTTNSPILEELNEDGNIREIIVDNIDTFTADETAIPMQLALWVLEVNLRPFFGELSWIGEVLAQRLRNGLKADLAPDESPSSSETLDLETAMETMAKIDALARGRSTTPGRPTSPDGDADG